MSYIPIQLNLRSSDMSKIDVTKLQLPTPKNRIKHRTQSGKQLSYVDARYCMDVLDAVVGPENWSDDYKEVKGLLMCGVTINVNGNKVTKWDTGTEANFEGEKSIVSDSFKRACVKWGVARDLYEDKKAGGNATPLPTEASSSNGPQPDSEYVVTFGKHKGKSLNDVPLDYIKYLLDREDFKKDPQRYETFRTNYTVRVAQASV